MYAHDKNCVAPLVYGLRPFYTNYTPQFLRVIQALGKLRMSDKFHDKAKDAGNKLKAYILSIATGSTGVFFFTLERNNRTATLREKQSD